MADHLIHQRVFKVSKALNRLDLLCEQHRRQLDPHKGLPDWEQPGTPAGKASRRHENTPSFFAWNEEPEPRQRSTWQNQTPQKVARTLEMTEEDADSSIEDVGGATELPLPVNHVEEGAEEDTAIEVDSDGRSEQEEPVVVGRSIAVSPARDDILDRVTVAGTNTVQSSTQPEAPPSPYHPSSSPRYRHGRRLLETNAAPRIPPNAAGVTTQQADHYRMSGSSGKRFRSPAKRTSLWDDLSNSYIHQSGGSNSGHSSFSHKRQALSAAERTFGGSSVFRTLKMQSRPRSGSTRGERRHVLTGPDAMDVANEAVREFLGGREEESKGSEPAVFRSRAQHSDVDDARLIPANRAPERTSAPNSRYRKNKRVSFGGDTNVDPSLPQPRTLPVLADKTTQTDDSLLPTRKPDRLNHQWRAQDSPPRCAACETTLDESGRPRKIPRVSTDSVRETPAEQDIYRRRRSSNHLTNPIMTNPRYPPQSSAFQGRSTYSSVFNDRLAWR